MNPSERMEQLARQELQNNVNDLTRARPELRSRVEPPKETSLGDQFLGPGALDGYRVALARGRHFLRVEYTKQLVKHASQQRARKAEPLNIAGTTGESGDHESRYESLPLSSLLLAEANSVQHLMNNSIRERLWNELDRLSTAVHEKLKEGFPEKEPQLTQ